MDDINFILEDGDINIGSWDSFENIKKLIDSLEEETVILTQYKSPKGKDSVSVESLNKYLKSIQKDHIIKAMTFQSIKGLEAKNIILHNFDQFLLTTAQYDNNIMYRKIYVLFTRALENIYISIENEEKLSKNTDLLNILNIIKKHKLAIDKDNDNNKNKITNNKTNKISLAKLKPKLSNVKETGEMVIVASELFALVAGLFG